jgi:hypothetical protein
MKTGAVHDPTFAGAYAVEYVGNDIYLGFKPLPKMMVIANLVYQIQKWLFNRCFDVSYPTEYYEEPVTLPFSNNSTVSFTSYRAESCAHLITTFGVNSFIFIL